VFLEPTTWSAVTDLVIETTGLRKEYRRGRGSPLVAVDDLDLAVSRGGVHGFLGPQGSGKTTTLRLLLGLASPSAGTARVLGEPVPRRLPKVVDRVGAVVEHPKFSPGISARRNLTLLAGSRGVPVSSVGQAVERVGLAGRDQERYRGYTAGMRQRLAIAAALLKSPELVILDEPTEGLDSADVRAVRGLIRDLGSSGVTVLVSTHVLAEVQQVCDSVSIISRGRLLSSGPVEGLVGREQAAVRVGVLEVDGAARLLTAAGLQVTREGGHLYVGGAKDPAEITRLLAQGDVYVRELSTVGPDLESVFHRLAGDHTEDTP
jgi:ABC-2 type transport system ATP-binding protein